MEVYNFVVNCGVMDQPREIRDENWDLISRCFQFEPQKRPSFSTILDELITAAQSEYDLYESTSV